MTDKRPIFAVLALVAIIGLGIYAYRDLGGVGAGGPSASTTVEDFYVDGKKVGTIERVSVDSEPPKPIPDLTKTPKALIKDTSMTPEAWNIVLDKVRSLQISLTKNPLNIEEWVTLGTFRKALGDYPGTIAAWEYAHKLSPNFVVPLGNLADLYAYTLKDPKKAEEYFGKAIAADPKAAYIYFHAFDFYKNVLKDTTKARQIADLGVKNNPGNTELEALSSQ